MYDQDYQTMTHMQATLNIYNVLRKWYASGGKAVHNLTEHDRLILRYLKDNGMMF